MTRQASEVAPIMSTSLLGRMITCCTQNDQPVDYGLLTESVFSMWNSDERDQVVISWATSQVPFLWRVEEDDIPNQPSIISSHEEVKFNLNSNHLRFRDLQHGANKLCGDAPGFGSEFWLALTFDNQLVTGSKVSY